MSMSFLFVRPSSISGNTCFLSGDAVRFVPAWFPGAGFQRQAAVWREDFNKMESIPLEWAKKQIVSPSVFQRGNSTYELNRNLAITKSHSRLSICCLKMVIR